MIYFPLGASSSMPPTFECPICMGPLVEQMATRCGHMFCEGCIRDIQGRWVNAAKFLTDALLIGSLAIRIIPVMCYYRANIFLGTVMCYYRANIRDEWSTKESSLGMSYTL
ncbi:uncharacterized protein LOC118483050 isoform X1 [Helianthus annuus]|uniref:uncharacterized protein LOC118483048 isoform X1 n=1 Tax=Helianthus annuus TaxID=4232 RepID=UPI001652C24F|nr:uncharacterized protein LOC118483048 isoform X1 [Helianthus annuus]XP_035834507.1 uncharacterized protein LOC118483050 isoform X1 [Helianthus annuus]